MNKLVLSVILLMLFVGCNQSKKQQSGIEKTEFLIEEFDTIRGTNVKEFSELLKDEKIVDLPYLLKSDILLPYENNQPIEDTISATSFRSPNELKSLDKYFKLNNVNGLGQVLYEDIDLIEPSFNSLFHKRFKPINDSIEVLLMSSNLSDSHVNIWFILTYNNQNKKTVDNTIVAVFKTYSDLYYESCFNIEKDYTFKSIISYSYEFRPIYLETDYKITQDGKIEM